MSLSPELQKAYDDSCRPFIEGGGAISEREAKMHPWRVFLEINSACNLRCPTCTKGNQGEVEGLKYEHKNGLMDWTLMEQCIDKIRSENSEAIIFLYGNSEPWLHPKLPECIAAVKARGLRCEFSTNLNYIQRVEETLDARPDFIIISLSGFTQDVYVKGHAGGNIEKVKANMAIIGEANRTRQIPINVNYHLYNDNGHELEVMKEYAASHGIGFFVSTARAISIENSIQYLREKDGNPPFDVQSGRPDWNNVLPPPSQQWKDTMDRLKIPPQNAREMYANYQVHPVCPVGAGGIFTFIRHDGKTQMCACTADRRITVGDYLTTTQDEMIEQRTGHAICKKCIEMRLNLYFMIATRALWD
jgi:MoaA/NifB/PqqE/SkfB family radical SAM enzyme